MRSYKAQTYSIGDTSEISGASIKQIRSWESRGYIPKADRIQYGVRAYRRFSLKQVEMISRIKCFLDEGYTLPAATEKAKTNNLQHRKKSGPGGIE